MKRNKHEGGVKERIARREQAKADLAISLKKSTLAIEARQVQEAAGLTVEEIARKLSTEYPGKALRDIRTFNRSLRSKDRGKITLAVAQHLFSKYKVPGYLSECWYAELPKTTTPADTWRRRAYPNGVQTIRITAEELKLRRDWYITAASGGSLYKEHLKGLMTKGEVHAFLNCPLPCNFREAMIYSVAVQWTKDTGILTRVMKSKLNSIPGIDWLLEDLWREVIHFYCVNEMTFQQMNDLFDYFVHAKNRAAAARQTYNLKGRNLQSLLRQMQDWHYELARVKKMGNAVWEGIPVADDEFEIDSMPNNVWTFKQMKSSKDLAAEGTAMHHCVYSYQSRCVEGTSSIWSVRRLQKKKGLSAERCLTLEINENGVIVQIRGYANRQAKDEEMIAVRTWARKNYLSISSTRW